MSFLTASLVTLTLASTALSSTGNPGRTEERAKFKVELASEVVTVPIDHSDGHVNVDVAINGSGHFRFQVDTYASVHASIDDDLAKELGLEVVGQWPNGDGQKIVMRDVVQIDSLTFGGVTLRNLRVLVDDYDFVETKGGTLQGLIGFQSLNKHLVTFDYPRNELQIRVGSLEAERPNTLPFSLRTGAPDLELELGGEQVVVGIDTGSTAGLLLDRTHVDRLGIRDSLVQVGEAKTVYSTHAIDRGLLPHALDLAGHEIQPATAVFLDFPTPRGLLGHDVLRSFAVTFDGRKKLVHFELPPLPESIELTPEQQAVWVGTFTGEKWTHELRLQDGKLVYIEDDLPPQATLALSPNRLRLRANPMELSLETASDGTTSLVLRRHAKGRPTRAVRAL